MIGRLHVITDEVLQAMDSDCPLVMPLSNPTSKAECTLEAAAKALDGKLMFCSGSASDCARSSAVPAKRSETSALRLRRSSSRAPSPGLSVS